MGLYQFLTTTSPPCYGHQLNFTESLGNVFLYPFASSVGNFSIRDNGVIARICAIAVLLITLPLTLVGALLKGIGYIWPHAEVLATDENIKPTSQLKLQQCYDLSETLKNVCMANGFTRIGKNGEEQPAFAMVSGTALGAVRHGGIIPWDDDCDYAIFKEDEEKFLLLKERLEEEGIEIRDLRFDSTYKLHFTPEKIREKYGDIPTSDMGEIDVFVYEKMSDGCYTFDTKFSRSRWPTEFFTSEDIARGFEMAPFGPPEKGLTLPLVRQPDQYLARYYGENFKDYGIETHGHLTLNYGCGTVQIPFLKLGAHYFKIQKYKDVPAAWN